MSLGYITDIMFPGTPKVKNKEGGWHSDTIRVTDWTQSSLKGVSAR